MAQNGNASQSRLRPPPPPPTCDADCEEASQAEPEYTWDVFHTASRQRNKNGVDFFEVGMKLLKIVTYFIMFAVVLVTVIINKSTLFIITSNIKHGQMVECNITYSSTKVCSNGTLCSYENTTQPDCRLLHVNASSSEKLLLLNTSSSPPYKTTSEEAFISPKTGDDVTAMTTVTHEYVRREVCDAMTVRWIWAMAACIMIPYASRFLKCLWRVFFKAQQNKPPKTEHVPVMVGIIAVEIAQTFGLCLLVFIVLPRLDAIRGLLLTPAVAFIPSLLHVFLRPKYETKRAPKLILDILAVLMQASALCFWLFIDRPKAEGESDHFRWALPVSLILVSLSWWQNHVVKITQELAVGNALRRWTRVHRHYRYHVYLLVSFFKIAATLASIAIIAILERYDLSMVFDVSSDGSYRYCQGKASFDLLLGQSAVWHTVAVHSVCAFMAYLAALRLCKINMDKLSLALPLAAALPVTLTIFLGNCESHGSIFDKILPAYFMFQCPTAGTGALITQSHIWIALLWWLSFLWITVHIWFAHDQRLLRSERLFSSPLYSSVLLDQDIGLNKLKNDVAATTVPRKASTSELGSTQHIPQVDRRKLLSTSSVTPGVIPMIYVCATLWHETENEMIQMLKSLFRLDEDQCARRNAFKFADHLSAEHDDPDYYEMECHIMFDDAFEPHGDNDSVGFTVNNFVKQLVQAVATAGRAVHGVQCDVTNSPTRTGTPYGGRLDWMMPGGNKLIVHLKDKMKIRHRKRWSQVMYFYYLLAHRPMSDGTADNLKKLRAENTYILALDGDIDFQPVAVQRLLDLMQRNDRVGAACGRIHPAGSGPMVWYQKFEYAVGHWLQKATEHVLGCVLCSPGCFSLYRASALIDDNVISVYATKSTEARHYVQYDQGEDRWLCTLLLQQGHRVEYCAAADAQTFAPERFEEFYNQRRRWMPSTMANLWDLLSSWSATVRVNDDISFLYILYQCAMLISAVLGPGTIFMMIVGALQALDFGLDLRDAFIANMVPVIFYLVLCVKAKPRTQVFMAGLLTALYAVVMMLVLIGTIISIQEKGVCSPAAIFLLIVVCVFVIAGLFHPREILCLLHGALYFITIPSMYLLLNIYAFSNTHVVSWGTREIPKSIKKKPAGAATKEQHLGVFSAKKEDDETGWTLAAGDWLRITCCPRDTRTVADRKYDALMARFDNLEKAMGFQADQLDGSALDTADSVGSGYARNSFIQRQLSLLRQMSGGGGGGVSGEMSEPVPVNWLEDIDLGCGAVHTQLSDQHEIDFWKQLIEKYLHPLPQDSKQQAEVAIELKRLRNKFLLVFIMFNLMYIVIVCTLQAHVRGVHNTIMMEWPCIMNSSHTFELEPIGFVFILFFGILLLLQFIGMVIHRRETFWHIMATTFVNKPGDNCRGRISINYVHLAKRMQRLHRGSSQNSNRASVVSSPSDSDPDASPITRRHAVKRKKFVMKPRRPVRRVDSLEATFRQRLDTITRTISPSDLQQARTQANATGDPRQRFRNLVGRQIDENKQTKDALYHLVMTHLERFDQAETGGEDDNGEPCTRPKSAYGTSEAPPLKSALKKPLSRGGSAPVTRYNGVKEKQEIEMDEVDVGMLRDVPEESYNDYKIYSPST